VSLSGTLLFGANMLDLLRVIRAAKQSGPFVFMASQDEGVD